MSFLEIKQYLKEDSINPDRDIILIIWVILNSPKIFIHELCHFIAIFLTRTDFSIDLNKWKFLKRQKILYINDEGESEKKYSLVSEFPVELLNDSPLRSFIIGGAPIIGILLDIFLCFYIPINLSIDPFLKFIIWGFMVMWFVLSYKYSELSDDDIKCVKYGWGCIKEKIFEKISKIKKLFVYLIHINII